MPRYIIECDRPEDITYGQRAIERFVADCPEGNDAIYVFGRNYIWYIKKTKTGYSARTAGEQ